MDKPILLIIMTILGLGILGYLFFVAIKYVKRPIKGDEDEKLDKKVFITLLILICAQAIDCVLCSYSLVLFRGYSLAAGHHVLLVLGSLLLGAGFDAFIATFILKYYKLTLVKEHKKIINIVFFSSIAAMVLGILLHTEAMASYVAYPLPSSIEDIISILTGKTFSFGFIQSGIKFYGILIVGGALICYFVSDHYFYKKYGKHGILDTLFIVAFVAGIVGARLWSCLVLEPEYYLARPLEIITGISDGGMAIQGGLLLGAGVGIGYMLIFRKYVDIRDAIDIIVPTILFGQIVGRWGNFFNVEVYGKVVATSDWWFIPTLIRNTLLVDGNPAQMYVPLFLIESLVNLLAYFAIRYGVGVGLKKYTAKGDLAALYFVWYGLVRIVMEPLRDSKFGYSQSFNTAIGFVVVGVVIIAGFHLWKYLEERKGKTNSETN